MYINKVLYDAIDMLHVLPRSRCAPLLELSLSKDQVKQIHAQMVTNALLRDSCNLAKLMEKYCVEAWEGGINYAKLLFWQVAEKAEGTFIWKIMLKCASPEVSLRLFFDVRMHEVAHPDGTIYTNILCSCARLHAIREGWQVHAQLLKDGLDSHLALATTCIHFYATCRDIDAAHRLFNAMPERSSVSWNAMLTGYCINGLAKEALLLFKEMVYSQTRPTERTALLLISTCSQLGNLTLGTAIHSHVLKTIPEPLNCPFIGTGLVGMYAKCGALDDSLTLFHAMGTKNVVTWSIMAAALAIHGHGKKVMKLIDLMEKEGLTPNAIAFTSLLSACCHAGMVDLGLHLFNEMQSRFHVSPTMQHYGCIVDLLGRSGMIFEALEFIKNMPLKPDAVTWRALLSACKIHGEARLGREIGKTLIGLKQLPEESYSVTNSEDFVALSNVYALAEMWEDVVTVRIAMKKKGLQSKAGSCSIHNIHARLEEQTSLHS